MAPLSPSRVLVLLTIALCAGCGPASIRSPAATAVALPATPTTQPSRPVLGSTEDDFAYALGPPNNHSIREHGVLSMGNYQRCAGQNLDQYIVQFTHHRAYVISRQACSALPSIKDRALEAGHFIPPDSSGDQLFTSTEGEPGAQFMSRTLADAFTSDWFTDCDGSPVPAGTLIYVATQSGWDLSTGTC